ncbi:MAG TPA: hypothetical protein VM599_04165 [Thermoanaerobaculia bacterium]|nr:hypothetical protein [Thermoanaerobaculia bacterium]
MTSPSTAVRSVAAALSVTTALLLAAALSPAAAAATLEVTLAPETITVGDRVEALLVLTAGEEELAGEARFPVWGERWGAAEILEVGPIESTAPSAASRSAAGRRVALRQRLVLTAFRTGELELPPQRVALPGPDGTAELWTPAGLVLRVDSVLPAGAETAALEPRAPAPPRPLPLGRAFWLTLGAGSLLAAAAVALAARRRAASAKAPEGRLGPAVELARALGSAERAGAPEEAHVLLSLALRRYLGRAFGFPAAESTTAEIRRELRGRRAPAPVAARTDELLRACDRVKFAREPVERSTLEARIAAAREIAERLEAHLAPAPAPGGRRREEAA